ncbi:MAG: tRNA (adenosine(37)-N6)-dimethylallyltransferase MiaA [Planctomycetia bacterium]|nr:tRNA (adenosine(37)-N6)-dimethylallyltransferase MiaA [Planctomycetia bacterium]
MVDITLFECCLILTGPTASGKSAVALQLAKTFQTEIISMDSMTIYRGMDIGTAKPSEQEQKEIPHHLIDVLDPWEKSSVAWWLTQARSIAEKILARGKCPIIVGGTPLYLKAIRYGLFEGPEIDPAIRADLETRTNVELHQQLSEVDQAAAQRIHLNDHKRLVRALEVYLSTGQTITHWQQQFDQQPKPRSVPVFCIEVDRQELYRRIEARIDSMMQSGWLDEVQRLLSLPQPLSREASQAAGYRELIEHLQGKCNLDEAVVAIKTRTRQLAKRQLTWFRHFPGLQHLTAEQAKHQLPGYISSMTPSIELAGSPL